MEIEISRFSTFRCLYVSLQYFTEGVVWPNAADGRYVVKRPGDGSVKHIYYLPAPQPSEGTVFYIWLLMHHGATPRGLDLEELKVNQCKSVPIYICRMD